MTTCVKFVKHFFTWLSTKTKKLKPFGNEIFKRMKRMRFWSITLAGLLLLGGCRTQERVYMEEEMDEHTLKMIQRPIQQRNNEFAFDLMRHLPEYEENFVIAPFSISSALAMTYAGARGETQKQMATTLYFDPAQGRFHSGFGGYLNKLRDLTGEGLELNIANSLWAQEDYPFRDAFFNRVEEHYGSLLYKVDFVGNREQVREDINDWVFEETREKIRDLIAPGVFTDDTRLVLVNAVHFFGPWMVEFDKELTREMPFHTHDGERIMTDFMFRTEELKYYQDDYLQALEIPYAGGNFSMMLMLPAENKSLKDIEQKLGALKLLEIMNGMTKTEVEAMIPRFEAETKTDLEDVLAEMGMPIAFSDRADFSGMTGEKDLKIDKVIHQAMIEVAEEGTEAAAATAVVIIRKTAIDPEEEEKIIFRADRPFLFMVKDNFYDSILFMGRVNKP